MNRLLLTSVFLCTILRTISSQQVKCTSDITRTALMSSADCQPREKVIRLEPPGNMTADTMTPQYISVLRCGGACPMSSQSCVPVKQQKKDVPVIIASCGVESGVCDKNCYSLTVMEDLQCQCSCLDKQKQCGEGKIFMPESCSCRCQNVAAENKCKDAGRVWQTDTCTCGCPIHTIVPCSTGLLFDNETCSCLEEVFKRSEDNVSQESRVARSQKLIGGTEWLIIGVLSGVLILFLFITVMLLRSLIVLRRRIETLNKSMSPVDASYIRCTDPSMEDLKSSKYSTVVKHKNNHEEVSLIPQAEKAAVVGGYPNENGKYMSGAQHHAQQQPAGLQLINNKHLQDPFARLLDCEVRDVSLDSSASKGESGFESAEGGSRLNSPYTGAATGPETRRHFENDSNSLYGQFLPPE